MNISAFSRLTGLSIHTLRYYEQLGLIDNIPRNASGHRQYRPADAEWVCFIGRLKHTGMPLAQIVDYARLRARGDGTLAERHQLLCQHRDALQQRLAEEQAHLQALEIKLAHYQQQLQQRHEKSA